MDNNVRIKNITDKSVLTLEGEDGIHLIGLSTDGTIQVARVEGYSDNFSDLPGGIVVPLLRLTICSQGGLMLSSHNNDVVCFVNKDRLTSEINLLGGSTIEVAEKKLRIFIGPMARERRLLPSTPGVAVSKMPPPKPVRKGRNLTLPNEDKCDWFQVHHPTLDEELLEQSTSPKQLGDLAASFLTKQIHMYTDSRLSAKLTDQIFKFLQEVAEFQKDILMDYVKEITQLLDEMPEAERDKPMHAPSIKLLVELLRQVMDPMSNVVLCLQLLRKFSHFPQNLRMMMKCQAAAAVMGCMAVYLNQQEVQLNSLDILAKITTYQYQLNEKVQIRETGLEMILRAMQHHDDHEHILQAGCRTLANITTTLQTILDAWLDISYNSNPDVEEGINRYESLLKHIFSTASAVVQKILQGNSDNIGIRTEGRRFLYNLSKMTQILTKKEKRCRVTLEDGEEETDQERTSDDLIKSSVLIASEAEVETKGILRQGDKATGLRKVHFVDEFSFTMSTCSTVSTCSELGSDGEEDIDLVRRRTPSSAVIEVTESRKMTNSEIQNLQQVSEELECESIIQSRVNLQSDTNEVENETETIKQDFDSELESSEEVQKLEENCNLEELSDLQNQSDLKETPENSFCGGSLKMQESRDEMVDESMRCNINDSSQHTEFELFSSKFRIVDSRRDGQSYEFPKSFSVSDVEVLTNVIRLKIVEYVSCLVYDGNDKQALKAIDLPLLDLLEKSKALPELIKYVQQQYNPSKTLLDIDTSYLIGIIDAVRYTSLLPDLIRKALLDVVLGMTKNKDQIVMYIAVEGVKSVFQQETLASAVTEETYLATLQSHVKVGKDDTGLLGDLQRLVKDNQNCSLC